MKSLIGKEIFAVGKWNGLSFSDKDLQSIVNTFNELASVQKVPLKFGHNEEQPVTDGKPALGWVDKVYIKGKKLLADFSNMPDVVYDAVKAKLYRTVSIELLKNVQFKGKTFPWVLDAVALLGADQPAVNTLEDLNALMARCEFVAGGSEAFSENTGTFNFTVTEEETTMDEKQVQDAIAKALQPLSDKVTALEADKVALSRENEQLKADAAKADADAKAEGARTKREEFTKLLDDAVKAEQILPRQREAFAKMLNLDNDEAVIGLDRESVLTVIGVDPKKYDGQHGFERKKGSDMKDHSDKAPDEQLVALAKQYQAEKGENDFQVAFTRVAEANPELHKEYINMTGGGE